MRLIDALEMEASPVATILVNTYNHQEVIQECLESIISQEVAFSCELLIWDDCSSDNTTKVINEIIPDKRNVKKIFSDENSFSQGFRLKFFIDLVKTFRGKVFFYIEGDDFWKSDGTRIQKMTQTLMDDASLSMCFTDTFRMNGKDSADTRFLLPDTLKKLLPVSELRRTNYSFIHLGASCFRNVDVKFPGEYELQRNGDMWFPYLWSDFGAAKYLDACGHLVYRYDGKGVWSSLSEEQREINKLIYACQLTSDMLKKKNLEGALFNARRFLPLINNNPFLTIKK